MFSLVLGPSYKNKMDESPITLPKGPLWTDLMKMIDYCGKNVFCREDVIKKLYDNDLLGAAEYLF